MNATQRIVDFRMWQLEQRRNADRNMRQENNCDPEKDIAKKAVTLRGKIRRFQREEHSWARKVAWATFWFHTFVLLALGPAAIFRALSADKSMILAVTVLAGTVAWAMFNVAIFMAFQHFSDVHKTQLELEVEELQHEAIEYIGLESLCSGFWERVLISGETPKSLPAPKDKAV